MPHGDSCYSQPSNRAIQVSLDDRFLKINHSQYHFPKTNRLEVKDQSKKDLRDISVAGVHRDDTFLFMLVRLLLTAS